MHERLSELLGHEVVGEVTRVGDTRAHLDVGLGRVCLDRLDGAEVEELLGRLRKSPLGAGAKVRDRLRLEQPKHLVRGLVEVQVADETLGSTYVLQLTTAPLLALYERRFVLEPGVHGDLAGVICRGLATVFEGGREAPLRQISGYDDLQRRYLEQLDAAVRAAATGDAPDPHGFTSLATAARDCWQMLPWPLRGALTPASDPAGQRLASLDEVSGRTVLLAADVVEGEMVHEYTHQHHELEEQQDVLGWMSDVHQALLEHYQPPAFQCALARASSVARFVQYFPRYQPVLAP